MSQDYFEEIDAPRLTDGPHEAILAVPDPVTPTSLRRTPSRRVVHQEANGGSVFATLTLILLLGWCVYQGCSYDPAAEPATAQEETR